jgi:hypothetical protein
MIVIMREVCESTSVSAPMRRAAVKRFIQTHVRRMWRVAQSVQHNDFHAAHRREGGLRDFFAIVQVR